MYKPNNKKMLTVLITVAMVFSALAVLSLTAEPAYAASPSITFTPSELTVTQTGTPSQIGTTGVYNPTIATTSQISDSSSSTLYFYWSTSPSLSGIAGGYYYSASPSVAGQTYISADTILTPNTGAVSAPTFAAGASAYLIASTQGSSPSSAVGYGVFTVSSLTPSLDLGGASSASAAAGTSISVTGSGYNTSATSATLYFNYSGSPVVLGTVSLKAGSIASGQTVTVPTDLAELSSPGYYPIVALDASPGETAVAALKITPAVVFTPNVVGTSAGQVIAVSGYGFMANGWIQLNAATASITETNSAVQVGSGGSFSVSITTTSTLTAGSSTSVTISEFPTQTGGSSEATGSAYIYASEPGYKAMKVELASSPSTVPSSSDSEISGASTAYFVALNFPASTSLELTVGPVSVMSITTNSNGGFAGTYTVPTTLPAGTYTVTAVNSVEGLSAQTTATLTITGNFTVSTLVPGYTYLPSGYLEGETGASTFAVSGTGFGAGESIVIAYSGTGTASEVTLLFASALSGDFQTVQTSPQTSLNGSFNVTVNIVDNTGLTANTAVDLSVYDGTTQVETSTTAFVAYVSPSLTIKAGSSASSTYLLGAPYTSSAPDYILVTSNTLLPSTSYTLMLGTSDVTSFTTTASGAITGKGINGAPTPSSGIEFPVPSVSSGYYPINIALSGSTVNIADPLGSFFLVTVPGGTPTVVLQDTGAVTSPGPAGQAVGSSASDVATDTISVFAYNFPSGSTGFTIFSADGLFTAITGSTGFASDTSGGAYATGSGYGGFATGTVTGGNYLVSAYATSAGATVYASPSNSAIFTVIGSFNSAKYTATVGGTVSFSANGLAPNTNYDLLFNGQDISSTPYLSSSAGAISTTTFTVPYVSSNLTLGYSYYSLQLVPVYNPVSSAAVASAKVKVEANSAITLSTSSQFAFPGQLVQFSVTGFTAPSNLVLATPGPIQYFANISLNGTLIATVPATFQTGSGGTTYLNGSFINPNNAPGSYYLMTFTGYEQASALSSTSGSVSGGSIVQLALGGSQSGFFGLVSGNGALLTGISPTEIATLEAAINGTVSTSLTVPIADLNAAITSINGAVAKLKTTVGNITTDLSTINATVASIQSGMVLVQTDLGSISTSLASLNASLVAFNGNVVMINTTLGQVQTSLSSIGTQVTANGNGIATVKTDIGTVQGQITATNGNITTIHTALGDLNATVNKISTSTTGIPTLEIFLIVIIVLVLITLVLAFLAVSAANKAARRATEEKKQ